MIDQYLSFLSDPNIKQKIQNFKITHPVSLQTIDGGENKQYKVIQDHLTNLLELNNAEFTVA